MQTKATIKVRGFHVDHFGHVNNARYLEFLEEGRWIYFEKNNLIEGLFHKKGIIPIIKKISIKYLRPAFTGQTLEIMTSISRIYDKDIEMVQTIHDAISDKTITKAVIINRLLDLQKNRSLSISEEFLSAWPDLNKD